MTLSFRAKQVADPQAQLNFEQLSELLADPLSGALGTGYDAYDYGFVTALPTSPTPATGYTCTFTDSLTAPTYRWQLQYLSTDSGSYDWQFIGGTPMFDEIATAENETNTSYDNMATTGPSITTPLAGDYEVEIGASIRQSTNAQSASMSYAIGGTGAVDADRIDYWPGTSLNIATAYANYSRPRRKTALSASTALVAKYKVTGGTGTFEHRWMRVTPVRVG